MTKEKEAGLERAFAMPDRQDRRSMFAEQALVWILLPVVGWVLARVLATHHTAEGKDMVTVEDGTGNIHVKKQKDTVPYE